jgi:hypothetical protein
VRFNTNKRAIPFAILLRELKCRTTPRWRFNEVRGGAARRGLGLTLTLYTMAARSALARQRIRHRKRGRARCEGSRHERRGSRRYGSLCGRQIHNSKFHPRHDQWDEHFERNRPLVFGRNAVGRATVSLLRTPKISSVYSSGFSFWRCTVASNPRGLQHYSKI